MSDSKETLFTDEEVFSQAKGNAAGAVYALIAYAKECGRSPADVASFVGSKFAPSWENEQGQGASRILRYMALNLVSCGAEVRSFSGDDIRAEARISGFPSEGDAAAFGVSQGEADRFYDVFGPIAKHVGSDFDWRRHGDEVVMTVQRKMK